MKKSKGPWLALMVVLSLVAASCGSDETSIDETSNEEAPPTPEDVQYVACQVTDSGGIDDKSFNETAWKGVTDAEAAFGIGSNFVESTSETDFEPNIASMLNQECDIIITVGFELEDATAAAAEANPDQQFSIVDGAYDPPFDNVRGLTFDTRSASFLAGYAAAATTQTGVVGTFGGLNIPPVVDFMEGFRQGVEHHNTVNGTDVKVLGWDGNDGLFTGNFDSTEDGKAFGENLIAEGADIILPVAGPVGLGTAAAAREAGDAWIIGVDSDWTVSAPEAADVLLTSVLKNIDVAVYETIELDQADGDVGTIYLGTLDNGGVGIADFAGPAADVVPAGLADEIATLIDAIVSGEVGVE